MKTLVVIFTLCVAGILADLTPEQREMLKPFKNVCITETGVSEASILKVQKGDKKELEDQKMKCFTACMFKKLGFLTNDGKFDEDMTRAIASTTMPKDVLNKAVENCKNQVGKDACETAAKLVECFLNNGASLTVV